MLRRIAGPKPAVTLENESVMKTALVIGEILLFVAFA
jgi:hypothetical protein